MTEKKLVQQLKDIARKYPDEFLTCRTASHSWQPLEAAWLQDGNIERVLECSRCRARRVQIMNKDGYLVSGGGYVYTDGYALTGLGRLNVDGRAILRRASVFKLLK